MKRIHLFEFEDFAWFPDSIRECMTHYITGIHQILGSKERLEEVLGGVLDQTGSTQILDLCSGAGGPMVGTFNRLVADGRYSNLKLRMTDLYPNLEAAARFNDSTDGRITYETTPLDATQVPEQQEPTLRTMICSFHHMPVSVARGILQDAQEKKEPICIFEISDNGPPIALWWLAIFPAFILTFILTLKLRPLTARQMLFTYVIPILPLVIAWDGAVSNARTYTEEDIKELVGELEGEDYQWKIQKLDNPSPSKMLCLVGMPR